MDRSRLEENLTRMSAALDSYVLDKGINRAGSHSVEAVALAEGLCLAHSTSEAKFSDICSSNRLLSPQALHDEGIENLDPRSVEVALGTAGSVFLYAAPFRFPGTGCGLLFKHSLETLHEDTGAATAFDSGALVNVFERPILDEDAASFLARHELPLPDHRNYLQQALTFLFSNPRDYIKGHDPHLPGPIGLIGGDRRRWTHEVRIPYELHIRTGYLEAVFVSISRSADPSIHKLLRWCEQSGVEVVHFHSSRANDFETLKRECVDYIIRKLL